MLHCIHQIIKYFRHHFWPLHHVASFSAFYWAWLHKRTLLCKHRAVGEDAFSLIWDAREILGESTRIKELRRKLGREVFSFLAASHLYIWVNLNSLWEAHLHHHHTPLHRHHALESWAHMVARISVPITRNRWKVTISFFDHKILFNISVCPQGTNCRFQKNGR